MKEADHRFYIAALENANARIRWFTACAERDISIAGEWSCGWNEPISEAMRDADDAISKLGDTSITRVQPWPRSGHRLQRFVRTTQPETTMNEWKKYERKTIPAEMRPYQIGEDLTGVSVGDDDRKSKGCPKEGDMIARDPSNHADKWLVNSEYFEAKFNTTPVDAA